MHWHQLRSQIHQVFQVTSHTDGPPTLHFVSSIQLLSLYHFIQFLTCTRIPLCSFTLRKWSCEVLSLHYHARRFSPGRWSFLGPGSEKKWYSIHDSKPRREWDRVAELMMIKSEKADTQSSDPRVHYPEERFKKQRWWKIINTLLCRWD